MISSSEIKRRALMVLNNQIFSNSWIYALIVCVVYSAVNAAIAATAIGSFLAYGILSCAVANYFSERVRGNICDKNLSAAVDGATKDLAGSLVAGLLCSVFIALWSLLFIIPGIVKSCSYAMTFYIKNDHPEMSGTEAIAESRRMMNGHKMDYFILQLSFIGWYIIGAICFGVGIFWVQAYNATANAVFYEELKAKQYVFTPNDFSTNNGF